MPEFEVGTPTAGRLTALARRARRVCWFRVTEDGGGREVAVFDLYLFADYSGAQSRRAQRRAICLAKATRDEQLPEPKSGFSRDDLGDELLRELRAATARGERVIFGQDHQYGLPAALLEELRLRALPWRDSLRAMIAGTYAPGAPALAPARDFARNLNRWLESQNREPYFYSATKASLYGLPDRNPRPNDPGLFRRTECRRAASGRGNPKPFNRVGDNGSVGGQTLVGLLQIERLLQRCEMEGIRIAIWPFDGLSIDLDAYKDAHVMIEPYPSAVRAEGEKQTNEADALACVAEVRRADQAGQLSRLLDLASLSPTDAELARIEGWIATYRPK